MKRSTMGGADQQPVFDQKLTWRPIQASSGVGALVVKRADEPIFTGKDQIKPTRARLDMGRDRPAFGDGGHGT